MLRQVWMLSIALVTLSSCAAFGPRSQELVVPEAQRQFLRAQLDPAWNLLDQKQADEALKQFVVFREKNPQSIFDLEALWGQARALFVKGELEQSDLIYQQIVRGAGRQNDRVIAHAFFERALTLEAMGSYDASLTCLRDAESRQNQLDPQVRLAALPARRAILLARLGLVESSEEQRLKAEEGLKILRAQGYPDKLWAPLYEQMGQVFVTDVKSLSWDSTLWGLRTGQVYLLKAIESDDLMISSRSLDSLLGVYRQLFQDTTLPVGSRGSDPSQYELKRTVNQRLEKLAEVLTVLQGMKRPPVGNRSPSEIKLWQELEVLDNKILQRLESIDLSFSTDRPKLLRKGSVVRSEPLFPNEVDILKKPVHDPNLQQYRGE